MDFAPIDLLVASAALNGVIAAPVLIVILLVANDKKRMGAWKNSLWSNLCTLITIVGLSLATLCLIIQNVWG